MNLVREKECQQEKKERKRNQGLFHPVLISRPIEYMPWEFKLFHSTTCCFHFLEAVSTAYNWRAEGHPATKARTTTAWRIISADLPDFVFRGGLSLLAGIQWQQCDWRTHLCGKFQVGAADGNLSPAFSPVYLIWMPQTLVISFLCVCHSSFIFAHSEREAHNLPDLFSPPILPKSREKSQSLVILCNIRP